MSSSNPQSVLATEMTISYCPQHDHDFAKQGHRFMGVARHRTDGELHIWQPKKVELDATGLATLLNELFDFADASKPAEFAKAIIASTAAVAGAPQQ